MQMLQPKQFEDLDKIWISVIMGGTRRVLGYLYSINFHLNIYIHFMDQFYKLVSFPWCVSIWIYVSTSEHTIIELFFP